MADRMRSAGSDLQGGVYVALAHDSARKHVTGQAVYVDDIPEPPRLLHMAAGKAERAHARLRRLDLAAVRGAAGVVAVLAECRGPT